MRRITHTIFTCTLLFSLLLIGCKKRKDNKVADKIEGIWDLTEYKYAGEKVALVKKQVMHFYSHPVLEKTNAGEGKIETTYNGYTFDQHFRYEVGNGGEDLALEIEFVGSTAATLAKIDKVKRNKLVYVISDENADAEFTFKKRK